MLTNPAVSGGIFRSISCRFWWSFVFLRLFTLGSASLKPAATKSNNTPSRFDQSEDEASDVRPLALPALDLLGMDDVCEIWVSVQNIGDEPSQAVMVNWRALDGPEGLDSPECSGLIAPGGQWDFLWRPLLVQTLSGMLFSFKAVPMGDLGVPVDPSVEAQLVGSYFCEQFHWFATGKPEIYAEFRAAYAEGDAFFGIPMAAAKGSALNAQVLRSCAPPPLSRVEVSSSYPALVSLPEPRGEAVEPISYWVAPVHAMEERHSFVYVQNTSSKDADVEYFYQAVGDCQAWNSCGNVRIEPGRVQQVDIEGCMSTGEIG